MAPEDVRGEPPSRASVNQPRIEKQMKSTERVRDLGEVFTPSVMVESMLDLLPAAMWAPHPSPTFLEPAAGDGNFLVAILTRKLGAIADARRTEVLPAGTDAAAVQFHALEALASIYGIDISENNIIGGTTGHEIGARSRMLSTFIRWLETETGTRLTSRSAVSVSATWVVERNLLVANMLPFEADDRPSRRNAIPLVEYHWQPETHTVKVLATTLGQVEASARTRAGEANLFDAFDVPTPVWAGPARDIRLAPIPAPPTASSTRNRRR